MRSPTVAVISLDLEVLRQQVQRLKECSEKLYRTAKEEFGIEFDEGLESDSIDVKKWQWRLNMIANIGALCKRIQRSEIEQMEVCLNVLKENS